MFATGHVHRRRKYQWAKERGAAGFLISSPLPGQTLVTGSSGRGEAHDLPAAGITQEGAAALKRSGALPTVARLELVVERAPAVTENLIAEIPGSGPEWVVLCAHYDGHDLAQSAIDNGSGVAVALEVARALASTVPSLRRGLRVVLFTVEEWGLMGSRSYVSDLSDNECQRIALVVNLDSVAGSASLTALTTGFDELETFLPTIAEECGLSLHTYNPVMANSDHASFARRGIPAFRLLAGFDEPESRLQYLLTPADTIDKVSPAELKLAAQLTAEILLRACTVPGRIARHRDHSEVSSMFAHAL
jgi:Zn-dependent M28 family amino/carboxypeptidase